MMAGGSLIRIGLRLRVRINRLGGLAGPAGGVGPAEGGEDEEQDERRQAVGEELVLAPRRPRAALRPVRASRESGGGPAGGRGRSDLAGPDLDVAGEAVLFEGRAVAGVVAVDAAEAEDDADVEGFEAVLEDELLVLFGLLEEGRGGVRGAEELVFEDAVPSRRRRRSS